MRSGTGTDLMQIFYVNSSQQQNIQHQQHLAHDPEFSKIISTKNYFNQ